VFYCDRACQKAAWPEHKELCKYLLAAFHGGKSLASAREFVLEYWRPFLPASFDVGLLPPVGVELDEAAAFDRCQGAAMDCYYPGYSTASSKGERRRLVLAVIKRRGTTRESEPSLADFAANCIDQLCPVALEMLLDAGAQPGDVTAVGDTLLQRMLWRVATKPYVRSAPILPSALDMLRLVLAHTQPGDWLIGEPGQTPLEWAASIPDAAVSAAALDCIILSPGGFPVHAVAGSVGALHSALQCSTIAFVQALLDAGADPDGDDVANSSGYVAKPLHALALASPSGHGSGSDFDAKLSLLLIAGARLEAANSDGWTPLVTAARGERAAAFDALLAAGARASALRVNTGVSPAKYWTVLHDLAENNSAAMIQRVLATGVLDVDARAGPANYERTPLHTAAIHDASRAVGALLAAGASLAATDTKGFDVLELAINFSSPKAARLLMETTPPAGRGRYKRAAVTAVVDRHRAVTAAAADLATAQAVSALFP